MICSPLTSWTMSKVHYRDSWTIEKGIDPEQIDEKMFAAYLDDSAKEELQTFARGKGTEESPMYVKILDAFEGLKKQQEALRDSVEALKAMIKELENKPKDSSYDEEIKELKREESALLSVLQELGKKNIFNFLSDEGLLPS